MDKILKQIRKKCISISNIGKDGNLQSTFSSIEILWAIYDKVLKSDDSFVLSKGQSNLALMVILAQKEIISVEELNTFCKFDSRISMQVDRTKFFNKEIEVSAGSLGHGLPMSVGMAMANKIQNSNGKIYCLVGDGEFNEGTMWESCILASSKKLDNLCIIVDNNKSIYSMIDVGNLDNKFKSFGFSVKNINGHDLNELQDSMLETSELPKIIIANTFRGYGSSTLMNDKSWFHRYPKNEVEKLLNEVDEF